MNTPPPPPAPTPTPAAAHTSHAAAHHEPRPTTRTRRWTQPQPGYAQPPLAKHVAMLAVACRKRGTSAEELFRTYGDAGRMARDASRVRLRHEVWRELDDAKLTAREIANLCACDPGHVTYMLRRAKGQQAP